VRYVAQTIILLPRNAAVAVLIAYRKTISPLYGDVCRYYPSCSHYGLQAVGQRGLIVGSGLTLRRLGRCHPWALGGVDDVPPAKTPKFRVTALGFAVPRVEERA
jgi:putative membrane protein insertion efficiency factor